ncbi:hypothetical protein [Mucilaginibacter sp. SP1R1]|uniref:hypothetical protein n=1 Tax=Mucilaginibacter sp. SP1R1 TaxID=2723091 RepID=UPI0016140529|nr:hypothetical protein [Mucilaginibacter sp. SP1R1]MBB6151722.1 hypothetical protein [Mucilaginibacter sp. SP1R1]
MIKYTGCFFVVMICCSLVAKAQFTKDYQGKPYTEISNADAEGSPYLITNWAAGSVSFSNGKKVTAKLKYDLMKDELLFQNKSDSSAMTFIEPVQGFSFNYFPIAESSLTPLIFGNGFPPVEGQTPASFYQVIADGKVKLLKHYKKVVRIDQAFNSATSTKTFVLVDVYYLFVNNQLTKIRPGQKTILSALNNKAAELQGYMKSNTINYKSDADLAKLFGYYNSL